MCSSVYVYIYVCVRVCVCASQKNRGCCCVERGLQIRSPVLYLRSLLKYSDEGWGVGQILGGLYIYIYIRQRWSLKREQGIYHRETPFFNNNRRAAGAIRREMASMERNLHIGCFFIHHFPTPHRFPCVSLGPPYFFLHIKRYKYIYVATYSLYYIVAK